MRTRLKLRTTDMTPTQITEDGYAARTGVGDIYPNKHFRANILVLAMDNVACPLNIEIRSRNLNTGVVETHRFKGMIERKVGVASTALVGVLVEDHSPLAPTRTVVVTADNVIGALKIECTSDANDDVVWLGFLEQDLI